MLALCLLALPGIPQPLTRPVSGTLAMAVSESDFQQAMTAMQSQMQNLERGLTARIALAEAEVLRLRSARDDGAKHVKSGILDSRKIYPQPSRI